MMTEEATPQSNDTPATKGFGLVAWLLFAVFSYIFTHLFARAMHYSLGSIIFYGLYPVMVLGLWLAYLISLSVTRAIQHEPRPSIARCFAVSLQLTACTAVIAYACYSMFWPHGAYIGP